MFERCGDVRMKPIDGSILFASVATIISLIHYHDNGSPANAAFLNAAHCVLCILLFGIKFDADKYIQTDVEVTFFVYGVLVGEVDSDSVLVLAFNIISLILYRSHRKIQRIGIDENTPAATNSTTYDNTESAESI